MKGSFNIFRYARSNLANFITAVRLITAIWLIFLSLTQETVSWVMMQLFIFSAICDALDGIVARWLNTISKFGAYFDRLADKIFVCPLLIILTYRWRLFDEQPLFDDLFIGLVALLVGIEMVLLVLGSWAYYYDLPVQSSRYGKTKMIIECIHIGIWFSALYTISNLAILNATMFLLLLLLVASLYCAVRSLGNYLYQYSNP